MIPLLKDEALLVPKVKLFNLKKEALLAARPQQTLLNGLVKMVFTQEELSTSKATDKRNTGVKPLDVEKCGNIRGDNSFLKRG